MLPSAKFSLPALALAAVLVLSGHEARAQSTYVGTFAMTDAGTNMSLMGIYNSDGPSFAIDCTPWTAATTQQWAFFLLPNGYYGIMNIKSTMFLGEDNAPAFLKLDEINQSKWTGVVNQQWYLYPIPGNKNFYALVNVGSGQVLTDLSANAPGMTEAWSNSLNQWWYLYFLRK